MRKKAGMGFYPMLWALAILVGLLGLTPLVYMGIRGFHAAAHPFSYVFSVDTLLLIGRSLLLAVAVFLASCLLAIPLAWLTVRSMLPCREFWGIVFAVPLAMPSYVGAYILIAALGPGGMMAKGLGMHGMDPIPGIYGFFGAWLVLTLFSYPYLYLPLRSALQGMDPALEDTARSLGKGPWRCFFQVTLPLLRPAIASGGLLVMLYALSDFGAVSLLRYEAFSWVIYSQYESSFDRSHAAILAMVLLFVTACILLAEYLSRGRGSYYLSRGAGLHVRSLTALGRWRWPCFALCVFFFLVVFVLPGTIIAYWIIRGLHADEMRHFAPVTIWHSIKVSLLAASVALAAGLPVAVLSVRRSGMLSTLLERFAFTGFALPGVVVALAMVFFAVKFDDVLAGPDGEAPWYLYHSLPLLIFAYVLRFLPQAVGAVRGAMLQLNPQVEEAGRALGRSSFQVFCRITLPLVAPGMMAGFVLVFLTTIKELPATLILGPANFSTLATEIWSLTEEVYFARAALPVFLLLSVAMLPMLAAGVIRKQKEWMCP